MEAKRTKHRSIKRHRAATADVVGKAPRKERVPAKWRKHYDLLIALRNQLLGQRGQLVKDIADEQPAFSLHMADAGTDSYDRDFALSRFSSDQDAVFELDQALGRIREGTYGVCELTGKPIEARRLLAIPWTRYSAVAEEKLEREGAAPRTHLARREHLVRGINDLNLVAGSSGDESPDEE